MRGYLLSCLSQLSSLVCCGEVLQWEALGVGPVVSTS